ncbi:hypothetical protein PVAP13_5NG360481 [Panicum virgatum]|uniref:Uncharacterized protein n=1 Tax=Panicum virgatum TaxID=38727 RepID=A0A8T0RYB7_PANVG|nr:hypothetical protein PVAP13_5NG360481 [Panicum virgatum]
MHQLHRSARRSRSPRRPASSRNSPTCSRAATFPASSSAAAAVLVAKVLPPPQPPPLPGEPALVELNVLVADVVDGSHRGAEPGRLAAAQACAARGRDVAGIHLEESTLTRRSRIHGRTVHRVDRAAERGWSWDDEALGDDDELAGADEALGEPPVEEQPLLDDGALGEGGQAERAARRSSRPPTASLRWLICGPWRISPIFLVIAQVVVPQRKTTRKVQ